MAKMIITPERENNGYFWAAASIIIIILVITLTRDMPRPFRGLHSWADASGAWAARSHVNYGLDYTKGMTTWAVGNPPTPNPARYKDHPQLSVLALALFMKIFGVSEFSYQLLNLFMSLATLLIVLKLFKGLLDNKTALLASLIYAMFPLIGYFGTGGFPNLFGYLAIYSYLVITGKINTRRSQRFYMTIMGLALFLRFLDTGHPRDLTLVHSLGLGHRDALGTNRFAHEGMVRRVIAAHFTWSPRMQELVAEEKIEAYCFPGGVIEHLLREIGAGRPGLFTHSGLGTFVDPRQGGGRCNARSRDTLVELMHVDGREVLHYKPFKVDVAIVRCTYADARGNVSPDVVGRERFERYVLPHYERPLAWRSVLSGINRHREATVVYWRCGVRRVNIRQLMPFEGTRAYTDNTLGRHAPQFRAFKENVRKNFDLPMVRRVFPVGTILRDVIIEQEGPLSFGRQMGSYPILAGFPLILAGQTVLDAVVVDHGMRSITALPVPVNVNLLPLTALRWIPGINSKTAAKIAGARPFTGPEEFRAIAGNTPIDSLLSFTSPSVR